MRIKLSLVDDNGRDINYHNPISLSNIKYKDLENVILNDLRMILDHNLTLLKDSVTLVESFNEDKKR